MTTDKLTVLRPLNMGQLLDQAIRFYRRSFFKFVGIVMLMLIPVTITQVLINLAASSISANALSGRYGYSIFTPAYFATLGGTLVQSLVSMLLLQGVAGAAMTRAVADQYLGRSTGFLEAYRRIGRSWLPLVGALLLSLLLSLVIILWTIIPCAGWFTGIGIVLIFRLVVVPMIAPVVVIENRSPLNAITRAWDLVRRRFWWVAGFVVLLLLFGYLVAYGPALVAGALLTISVQTWTETFIDPQLLVIAIGAIVSMILNLIYQPLLLTATTLLYFDLRIRSEGLDLAVQAEKTLDEQVEMTTIAAQSPQERTTGLFTWAEMGYFAAISVGALALLFVVPFGITALGLIFFRM